MKYEGDFRYMSLIQTVSDVNNTFLSRREITCNFTGLAGKLKKLEAVDMITKEFSLDDKVIIPMRLKNHAGKSTITGTFFVYDDEGLAKKHIDPTIFSRLEKSKNKQAEAEKAEEAPAEKAEEAPAEKAEEAPAEKAIEGKEAKPEQVTPEGSKEEKSE
jgi:ribosomal protein S24E